MSKILLVEDNEMNRDMLSRRLQRKGFEVVMAVDGQAALGGALSLLRPEGYLPAVGDSFTVTLGQTRLNIVDRHNIELPVRVGKATILFNGEIWSYENKLVSHKRWLEARDTNFVLIFSG